MLIFCLLLWPLLLRAGSSAVGIVLLKKVQTTLEAKNSKKILLWYGLCWRGFQPGVQNAEYKYRIYFRLRWLQEGFWLLSCPKLTNISAGFQFFRFSVDSNPNGGTLRNIYRCSLRLASTHHQYLRVKQAKCRCAVYTCVCCVLDATIKIDTMWQVNFDQLHP